MEPLLQCHRRLDYLALAMFVHAQVVILLRSTSSLCAVSLMLLDFTAPPQELVLDVGSAASVAQLLILSHSTRLLCSVPCTLMYLYVSYNVMPYKVKSLGLRTTPYPRVTSIMIHLLQCHLAGSDT